MKFPFRFYPVCFLIIATVSGAALFLTLQNHRSHEQSKLNEAANHEWKSKERKEQQQKATTGAARQKSQYKTIEDSAKSETARDLLDRFYSENPDIEKRSKFCSDLIAKLCRSGRSSEAWSLIDPDFGNIRRAGIVGYFASSDDSVAELVAKMRELDPKSDFQAAYTGLAFRFPLEDLTKFLTSIDFKKFSDEVTDYDMKKGISNALSGSLQLDLIRAGTQDQILTTLGAARSLHDSDFLSQEMFMNLLIKKNTGDAFSKWGFVEGLDENSEWGADSLQARGQLILSMISEDASRAIEILLKNDGIRSEADLDSAISLWSSMDSGSASAWFSAHKGALDANKLDRIASGFSNAAMESKEFESARLWAQQVTNSETKGKLLGKISNLADSK